MFAGVATGVRKATAAATHRLISTGRADTSSWSAAETAIGIITSAVAVLLMSWPKTTVITNSATSSTSGPASPTASTMTVGHQLAGAGGRAPRSPSGSSRRRAARWSRRSRGRPAARVTTRSRIMAPAASSAATTAGTTPVASSTTIAGEHRDRRPASRGPSGTDWRRTRSGESTTSTSWPRAAVSRADHGPSTRSVSPAFSRTGPAPRSWPWRVTASTIRLAV